MREILLAEARKYVGAKFGHQGRRMDLLDCGGLVLLAGRGIGLTSLEFLSYANFPGDGKFEALLKEHAVETGECYKYPFKFSGTEFEPGDLAAFDYGNGEGVRHIGFISKWDGRRFWVIDAQPDYGVTEHPLAFPFAKQGTLIFKYQVNYEK